MGAREELPLRGVGGGMDELERATARLGECGFEEMAAAVAERGAAIGRMESPDVERLRAVVKAGEAAIARVRAWQAEWREELARMDQAERWVEGLGRVEVKARGRVDVRG